MTGNELKAWRKRLGISQSRAARVLRVGITTINNYENGRVRGTDDPWIIPYPIELATMWIEHCEGPYMAGHEAGLKEGREQIIRSITAIMENSEKISALIEGISDNEK